MYNNDHVCGNEAPIVEAVDLSSWTSLIDKAIDSLAMFDYTNVQFELDKPEAMYFANRLHLLNLATIYSTGFECPDTDLAITEIEAILKVNLEDYSLYNAQNPSFTISEAYLSLYAKTLKFVQSQPNQITNFDHFTFIKDFVNPLFTLNQLLKKN